MNINKWACALAVIFTTFAYAKETSWNEYKIETLEYQKNIPGWCVPEKVLKLLQY